MQAMSITYKGFVLKPVAEGEADCSLSKLIITGPDGRPRASGVLGCFASHDEACRFALEHGITQIDEMGAEGMADPEAG
jgi:hypothetical protein